MDPVTLDLTTPLRGDFDVDAFAASVPSSYTIKGLFFERLRERVAARWDEITPRLKAPPRLGRYVPFSDYPHADYVVVSCEAAATAFPTLSLREALRQLAHADFAVFAETTVGRVVLAAAGDARSAMLSVGKVYTRMAPGEWEVTAQELDERTIRVDYVRHVGTWEYQLGQVEGLLLHYGASSSITVSTPSEGDLRFDVVYA